MMMQTEPSERQAGKQWVCMRLGRVARGLAAVLVVCALAPLYAETIIAHTRTRARQAPMAHTERAKNSVHSSKGSTSKTAVRRAPVRGVGGAVKPARGAEKRLKPEPRGRLRSRRHAEPVEEPEPVLMHRASSSKRAANARRRTVLVAAREAAAAPKALTVDDFLRAAVPAADEVSEPSGRTYVRGESRTEADNRVSDGAAMVAPRPRILALKPVVKPAAVIARVEPNPAVGGAFAPLPKSSMTMVTPPEDLTGAPLDSSADAPEPVTARRAGKIAIAPLPPMSREEVTEEVEQPLLMPGLYRNGRLLMPAPLKGTHEILVHQNLMADDEGLERIEDDYDLRRLRAAHLLVDFPESASLHINPELAANRRCGRVWSVRFATNIAHDFYARFHQPLQVNSAVRTVAYQVRLQRTNGNAAGIDGDTASPHLTGQAMDLGKRNMSMAQIAWMRAYLLPLMQAGKVDVEEEFQQACFHISVYRSYMPVPAKRRAPRNEVAQLHEPRVKSAVHADELR